MKLQTFGTITSRDALSSNVAKQIFAAREDIVFFFLNDLTNIFKVLHFDLKI